ncbi:uncharacterized protein LOC119559416 isoform X2 [Drosophila subpulchrella]|uniref:uncharacterized protein LOC119559416 isoform X2 n=1 Tax=Drosophila subpulchrella TaxID=1486046 RepID=UPI0018A143F5|nr:uncharacterized protein LOC119559416 isoform X2 [Drosophila subpulchrella]
MSKRVSIMFPEEMPAAPSGSSRNPMPNHTVKSSIKNAFGVRPELEPPVFVVVSPHGSRSSMTSGQQDSTRTYSRSSFSQSVERGFEESAAAPESSAMVQSGSANSQQSPNFESTTTSIKEFLRSTVALVKAGESFTSVKRLFHKFIKSNGSISNPKPSLVLADSSSSQVFTVPSSSQMTPTIHHSNYSFKNQSYDITSLLSDITPLTGYSPRTTLASTEAGYPTDSLAQSALQSVRSETPLEGATPGSHSKSRSPSPLKFKTMPSQIKLAGFPRCYLTKTRSSSRSLRRKMRASPASSPRRSPKLSPRIEQAGPAVQAIFALVSSSGPNSEGSRLSSQSRRRSSRGPSPNVTGSASSGSMPDLANSTKSISGTEPFPGKRRSSRRSSSRSPGRGFLNSASQREKSEMAVSRGEGAFAMVSPEEVRTSELGEGYGGEVEEASTSCRTYQEQCNCHHCQDMRRAVRRADFFQSPEGQRRLEAKLLAKNFFMDLCALTAVRRQIVAELHGARRRPSSRVSYPVSIYGAARLDGGSLSLQWLTHDLDSVDHFDIFVDDVPSRSVYNRLATRTVLVDVDAAETHRLRMRAVPERGSGGPDSSVEKFMSEVAAGHMRHVRQGQLFARCFEHLDALPQQRTVVDFWRDSEFLYMPPRDSSPSTEGR